MNASAVGMGAGVDGAVATARPTGLLGGQEFLMLLVTELRMQNPLDPLKDRDFVAQLAQFSALEAMQKVDASIGRLAQLQELGHRESMFLQAAALVGKKIRAVDEYGVATEGAVDALILKDGELMFMVQGQAVPLGDLVEVAE